jgi:hypothetical protein
MFKIGDVLLSDDIAHARFACDVTRCKGACCVVGNAGAPVLASEVPVLNRAFETLKETLPEAAVQAVGKHGVVQRNDRHGLELTCVNDGECVFVTMQDGVAHCAIQKAWYEGRFDWEKPISCHLYPIRLKKIHDLEIANFEYIPEMCGAACERGDKEGIWLSDFLKAPLQRRYGEAWYAAFSDACEAIRRGEDPLC